MKLANQFVMPKFPRASRLGNVSMGFSDKILIQDYATLKSKMIEEEDQRVLQSGEESDDIAVDVGVEIEKGKIVISAREDLVAISSLLKLTGSIKAEIVPGIEFDEYIDKKGFTWQLQKYAEDAFELKFEFENPEYISVGSLDTMKI